MNKSATRTKAHIPRNSCNPGDLLVLADGVTTDADRGKVRSKAGLTAGSGTYNPVTGSHDRIVPSEADGHQECHGKQIEEKQQRISRCHFYVFLWRTQNPQGSKKCHGNSDINEGKEVRPGFGQTIGDNDQSPRAGEREHKGALQSIEPARLGGVFPMSFVEYDKANKPSHSQEEIGQELPASMGVLVHKDEFLAKRSAKGDLSVSSKFHLETELILRQAQDDRN